MGRTRQTRTRLVESWIARVASGKPVKRVETRLRKTKPHTIGKSLSDKIIVSQILKI